MSFLPAFSIIQAPDTSPVQTAFVLHGIFGHQRNWRTFARAFVSENPRWRLVLVDLRNHGESHGAAGPHNVEQTALDLVSLAEHLGAPEAVWGHSFGGKVALMYAALANHSPKQVWVLDSFPGRQEGQTTAEMKAMIARLRAVAQPVSSRETAKAQLMADGVPSPIAQWMTTNLKRQHDGYRWIFNLDAVESMIEDYFELDAWSHLPRLSGRTHLVLAANNPIWTQSVRERLDHLSSNVQAHSLEKAGHWVHVDNPAGLLQMLSEHH
jgi:pimeloyl-ACP methyl ester carboxylesterase